MNELVLIFIFLKIYLVSNISKAVLPIDNYINYKYNHYLLMKYDFKSVYFVFYYKTLTLLTILFIYNNVSLIYIVLFIFIIYLEIKETNLYFNIVKSSGKEIVFTEIEFIKTYINFKFIKDVEIDDSEKRDFIKKVINIYATTKQFFWIWKSEYFFFLVVAIFIYSH